MSSPVEIASLERQLAACRDDAAAVAAGLGEEQGAWCEAPGSWSVAHCLDHLATANRVYLAAMRPPAERARAQGRTRRRPARPGLLGRLFAWSLEPPARPLLKRKAPRKIRPQPAPALGTALSSFEASQQEVLSFLHEFSGIDLASVRFPNPFVTGLRFSLATGLHVIAAHERRHLWQAWNVRRAAERSGAGGGRAA